MKILITGSRALQPTAENLEKLSLALDEIYTSQPCENADWITEIIHGGAKGGDELASLLAQKLQLKETIIRPDYKKHYPKLAPLKRNDEMITAADMTIAIYAKDRSGGTWYTAQKTLQANKPLLEIMSDGTTKYTKPTRGLF